MKRTTRTLAAAAALALCGFAAAQSGEGQTSRATELRADKVPTAAVLRQLPAGATVKTLSLEGGWAWVEAQGVRGWVRAGTLKLPSVAAPSLASGRTGADHTIQTLGVRSLAPRQGRHALVITIGKYKDKEVAELPGTKVDAESAAQMARAMQIPPENITYLRDEQATGDAIRKALKELDEKVAEGDRVYIHFSGHGTRFKDPKAGGCVEALLAHDGGWSGTLTNREMASLLAPMSAKTDKMLVFYDACHSGGVLGSGPAVRTRSLVLPSDEGRLRGKFTPGGDGCDNPVNVKGRNLLVEATDKGTLPQDIVHISSSRDNEISFDDENKGGLATQFLRDCMLRDAVDLDGSGAISIDEVRMCAQQKLNKRMENDAMFKPSNIVLTGNAGFVPAWFGMSQLQPVAPLVGTVTASVPAALPLKEPPPPLTGAQALKQLYDQRDAKRKVTVDGVRSRLQIAKDTMEFSVSSDRKGYVYVAMAGSDNQSVYVLFPNELDTDNMIEAGKPLKLPRASWRVRAAGPAGTDELLVLVTDTPRNLSALPKAGAFIKSLNNAEGRANLGALMTRGSGSQPAQRSDAFGATMFKVEETP